MNSCFYVAESIAFNDNHYTTNAAKCYLHVNEIFQSMTLSIPCGLKKRFSLEFPEGYRLSNYKFVH